MQGEQWGITGMAGGPTEDAAQQEAAFAGERMVQQQQASDEKATVEKEDILEQDAEEEDLARQQRNTTRAARSQQATHLEEDEQALEQEQRRLRKQKLEWLKSKMERGCRGWLLGILLVVFGGVAAVNWVLMPTNGFAVTTAIAFIVMALSGLAVLVSWRRCKLHVGWSRC